MDQYRQIGEVLGSLKALMVLKHDISINQKQCCLLFDLFNLAFETISEEIRQNLRLEDKNTRWKALEYPLRELHKIFKEGELYIKYCLEIKDWWGKAIILHQNKDCVELHIHNLFCCFPVVIEAIETAAEISALHQDDMQKRRLMLMRKYDSEWNDPKLFQWMFGKQYLVPRELCYRLETAWKEDRFFLLEALKQRSSSVANVLGKAHEQRFRDLLINKLSGSDDSLNVKILPSCVLVGAKDYNEKRTLGSGRSHYKEIQWLGENFALRTFYGEIEPLNAEISLVLSISHPNIMQYFCAFYDEEKKEGFLVMELMQKNLSSYVKENSGQRKRVPFSIPIAVDIMLQIARGMECLHSQKIYHGDLKPSNILLKARSSLTESYFHAKLTGFGVNSIKSYTTCNQSGTNPVIWYAPEVLAEQERGGSNKCSSKYTEKADVYSFAMICFELLTGKVPFEDDHLQGDNMVRNIRLGGRPLFSHPSPKYLANLTKKCWQPKPSHRPSFYSICRILRYIKKVLVINPDHGQPDAPPPLVDYCDIEAGYLNKFPKEGSANLVSVTQIPFQMFSYKIVEKEKASGKSWDMASEASLGGRPASFYGDENGAVMDDLFMGESDQRSVRSEFIQRKNSAMSVADLRSVFSEFPPRKSVLAVDQSSVCSESPSAKFLSFAEAGQSPLYAKTPDPARVTAVEPIYRRSYSMNLGRKTSTGERKSVTYDIPEKKMLTTFDQNSGGSETTETKVVSTENAEKIPSNATSDEKQVRPEASDSCNLLGSTSDQNYNSSDTRVKKTVPKGTAQRSNSVIPERKAVTTTEIIKGANSTKPPEKRVVYTRKLKDTNTSKSSSKSKGYSPSASSAQVYRRISSPRSSPARAGREYSSSISSRALNGISSPRSSPARVAKECLSSTSSPARGTKEVSSPSRPSTRYRRTDRER